LGGGVVLVWWISVSVYVGEDGRVKKGEYEGDNVQGRSVDVPGKSHDLGLLLRNHSSFPPASLACPVISITSLNSFNDLCTLHTFLK